MKVCKLPYGASEIASSVSGDIKRVCKQFGKRFSCSQGERDAAEFLADQLKASGMTVQTQPFKTHPQAYFGWINFTTTCLLLSIAAYFFSALVSILLLVVAIFPYLIEYVLFKRLYDPLFKREQSQNVYAVKPCAGEMKKRIVLVSHYDAGNEWRTKYSLGSAAFVAQRALNIIGIFYFIAINIARWALVGGIGAQIASGAMLYAGLAGLLFVIPWGATYFFIDPKRVIDGANDGLSSAVTEVKALDALKDVAFENTEVCVLLTGSGAVGERGAMAFVDAHGGEFGDETVFVVSNILREKDYLRVNTREFNGFVKSDEMAAKLVFDAASALGVPCHSHIPIFSNTESGVFSTAGLRSVGVNAVNRHMPDYYRTRYDTYENLSEDCIAMGLRLALELIGKFSGEYRFELADGEEKSAEQASSSPQSADDGASTAQNDGE